MKRNVTVFVFLSHLHLIMATRLSENVLIYFLFKDKDILPSFIKPFSKLDLYCFYFYMYGILVPRKETIHGATAATFRG